MRQAFLVGLGGLALAAAGVVGAQQGADHGHKDAGMSDAAIIKSAIAAAPAAVGKNATVIAIEQNGNIRTVRQGTNNFTCMADNPQSPGPDAMCVDANGVAWLKAWMSKTAPPSGQVGFGYMLTGGSDATNDDPFATAPPAGHKWLDTGPHVMVFGAGLDAAYPHQSADKTDVSQPYIMWSGTPYVHLMAPVK